MDQLSGGEMLIRALHDEGVEIIFGYPGGAVLHIYDAIFQQDKVEHILVRHEQAATHAADGYARSSGEARGRFSDFGARGHQCSYRNCNRLHGFDSYGGDFRPG